MAAETPGFRSRRVAPDHRYLPRAPWAPPARHLPGQGAQQSPEGSGSLQSVLWGSALGPGLGWCQEAPSSGVGVAETG